MDLFKWGTIYSAIKRYKCRGAAVTVSIVNITKGSFSYEKLDGRKVDFITAFLFSRGGHEDPKPLIKIHLNVIKEQFSWEWDSLLMIL